MKIPKKVRRLCLQGLRKFSVFRIGRYSSLFLLRGFAWKAGARQLFLKTQHRKIKASFSTLPPYRDRCGMGSGRFSAGPLDETGEPVHSAV